MPCPRSSGLLQQSKGFLRKRFPGGRLWRTSFPEAASLLQVAYISLGQPRLKGGRAILEKGMWDETYCPDRLRKADSVTESVLSRFCDRVCSSERPGPLVLLLFSQSSPGALPAGGSRDQLQTELLKLGSWPCLTGLQSLLLSEVSLGHRTL